MSALLVMIFMIFMMHECFCLLHVQYLLSTLCLQGALYTLKMPSLTSLYFHKLDLMATVLPALVGVSVLNGICTNSGDVMSNDIHRVFA